jgi:type I restriction enzyme S subunit
MSNNLPEGWKECKLGDVAEIIKDKYIPTKGDSLSYIGLEHIQEQTLRLNSIGSSEDITSDKFSFIKGDILFGKLRPYFRKVVQVDFNGVCSTDIWVIRPKAGVNQKYLFYLFANKELVDLSNSSESGTRMPRADWYFMSRTMWNIPIDQSEQSAIASVLSSFDDKIDLLNRENQTLEKMAEALFQQWFIEEADEKWEEVPLDQVADYLNGLACQKYPPKNEVEKLPVLKIKELKNGFTDDSDWATTDISEEYIVQNGDVIFSWSGSLLVKIWDGPKCVLNQHLFKITSKYYPKWFYYLWTKYYIDKFTSIAEGKATTMGHIKREDLSSSIVLIPSANKFKYMDKIISPIIEKIILNASQIRTLEKLRDTLLPKLMSGEVRVKL